MKNVTFVILLFCSIAYSQINVNIGADRVVQTNDTVTLTANVLDSNPKTLLDSVIASKIPLVLLDTTEIYNYVYPRDIIFIRDWVHNDADSPFAVIIPIKPNVQFFNKRIQTTILNNGNYNRHAIRMYNITSNDAGYVYDYKVNEKTITDIPDGSYLIFITYAGNKWNVIKEIGAETQIRYLWNTGDTTNSIKVVPDTDGIYSVEIFKGKVILKDNVIIKVK